MNRSPAQLKLTSRWILGPGGAVVQTRKLDVGWIHSSWHADEAR